MLRWLEILIHYVHSMLGMCVGISVYIILQFYLYDSRGGGGLRKKKKKKAYNSICMIPLGIVEEILEYAMLTILFV